MALAEDFVQEACAASGTADYTLTGPPANTPYVGFVAAFQTGTRVFYVVQSDVTFKWEIGWGIVTDATPDTLTRNVLRSWDTVTLSTSAKISWAGGDGALRCYNAPIAAGFMAGITFHRGTTAPAYPVAGMVWEDITSVTAVVWKHFDGTDWIALPWAIDETANAAYVEGFTPVGGARLTLTTALPVTVSDVSAATTIFLTPYTHNVTKVWNGTGDILYTRNEISLGLNSNSGHTGYHQADKNFDVFEYVRSAAVVLGTGPAWSSDTARAGALGRRNGRWTNNASIVLRHGTASGDTETVTANKANYIGTIRATANGQTEDSAAKRFVWNCYNRVRRFMHVVDLTDSWSYDTATIRQARATATNQLDLVIGLSEDEVRAYVAGGFSSANVGAAARILIGVDSTTTMAADCLTQVPTIHVASQTAAPSAEWSGYPGIGKHSLVWLEKGTGTGSTTFNGDAGDANIRSGINAEVMA